MSLACCFVGPYLVIGREKQRGGLLKGDEGNTRGKLRGKSGRMDKFTDSGVPLAQRLRAFAET